MRAYSLWFLVFIVVGCFAPACSSTSSGSTSAGGSGGSGGGSGGAGGSSPGVSCDGTPEQWCGDDFYCDAPEETCPGGGAGVVGTCAPRPKDCAGEDMFITCSCDGQIYINACEAHAAGGDVGPQDGCHAPADAFACGPVLCANGTDFCENLNGYHTCKPLPAACNAPDSACECLNGMHCMSAPGETECKKDADGHFFVTCTVTD